LGKGKIGTILTPTPGREKNTSKATVGAGRPLVRSPTFAPFPHKTPTYQPWVLAPTPGVFAPSECDGYGDGYVWCEAQSTCVLPEDATFCTPDAPSTDSGGAPALSTQASCAQLGVGYMWCAAKRSCTLVASCTAPPHHTPQIPVGGSSSCAGLGANFNWCGTRCVYGPCPVGGLFSAPRRPSSPTFAPWQPAPIDPPPSWTAGGSSSPSCPSGKAWCALRAKCILLGNDCGGTAGGGGGVQNNPPTPLIATVVCGSGKKWCPASSTCILNANSC